MKIKYYSYDFDDILCNNTINYEHNKMRMKKL